MKRRLAFSGMALLLMLARTTPVTAAFLFSFSGSDAGGTGSGTLSFDVSASNLLTVAIDNTSPTVLDNGTGTNSSGITAFGFNLDDPIPFWEYWKLTASDANGDSQIIGGKNSDGSSISGSSGEWRLSTTVSSVTLDFFPDTDTGVKGALYNPLASEGLGADPYFTTAVLEIQFAAAPPAVLGFSDLYSPTMRFQNVGLKGEGSLNKLAGEQVPIPSSALLVIAGIASAVVGRRRWYLNPRG